MTNRIRAERVEPSDISQVKVIDSASEISESYALYLDDESHSFDGKADMMFFPRSEQEVVAVLKYASDRGIPVTVQGARTGLTGAAVPLGGIVLNLEKMNRILYMDYLEDKNTYSICAEPGVLLEDLVKAVVSKTLRGIESNGTAKNQDALRRFMQDQDLYSFPVDPTETTAWLGGIVACNASGARTFRYGAVRDWVRHLRVALINGDVLDIERGRVHAEDGRFEITLSSGETLSLNVPSYKMPRTKNAAGLFARQDMDLIDLFIGSEGILGVITQVELILEKLPRNIMTVMAFFPTEDDAVEFVVDARRQDSPIVMNFLEYFDSNAIRMIREKAGSAGIKVPALRDDTNAIVFFEFSYEEEEMEEKVMALEEMLNRHNSSSESSWAGLDRTELEKMKVVRHFVPETINALIAKRKQQFHEVHKIGTDMAVPDEALREYLRFYKDVLDSQGMEYVIFGHIGNNHLHVNMLPRDNDEVKRGMDNYLLFAKKAVELGGTVAAEHGIGKLKRDFLRVMYGDKGIAEIQAVKSVLDPRWLLNRENMVPVPEGP
ncbi:MAG: FAD-binding oxidoreductase [Candidatus Thorarchaeota archaeon]